MRNIYKHIHMSFLYIWHCPTHHIRHCTKNYISFLQMFWKDGLSKKKLAWNMIFFLLSEKMIFLFPDNMILFFRRKRKDDLSQTKTSEYYIFCKCTEQMVFSKNSLEYDFSSIISKDDISISWKYDLIIYLFTLNWYIQIFLYYCKLCFLQIKSVQVCYLQNCWLFYKDAPH